MIRAWRGWCGEPGPAARTSPSPLPEYPSRKAHLRCGRAALRPSAMPRIDSGRWRLLVIEATKIPSGSRCSPGQLVRDEGVAQAALSFIRSLAKLRACRKLPIRPTSRQSRPASPRNSPRWRDHVLAMASLLPTSRSNDVAMPIDHPARPGAAVGGSRKVPGRAPGPDQAVVCRSATADVIDIPQHPRKELEISSSTDGDLLRTC